MPSPPARYYPDLVAFAESRERDGIIVGLGLYHRVVRGGELVAAADDGVPRAALPIARLLHDERYRQAVRDQAGRRVQRAKGVMDDLAALAEQNARKGPE
jgi:hypothetical protein